VRGIRVWARLLGLCCAVVEDVRMGNEGEVIVSARPSWRERDRCAVCRRRSPGYDLGESRWRWRALDLGRTARSLRQTRRGSRADVTVS
jgi:transposase